MKEEKILSNKKLHTISLNIGNKIQETRKQKNKTLDWLASQSGFTKGYLSKIENGNKIPPLGSLYRIAKALELNFSNLILDEDEQKGIETRYKKNYSITRKKERPPVIRGATSFGYDYVGLADFTKTTSMQAFLFTFPKKIDKKIYFEHEGEEFIFILKGKVEWHLGNEKYILNPGDSLYLDSRIPHKGRALEGEAVAIVVVSDGNRKF
jgi:transcriptional regulator with XRE-family HTH domain